MYDLVALGEALIDFTYYGQSDEGAALFEQNPGGAPANVAVMGAKLGLSVAFIGKIGVDLNGDFLAKTLREQGVDTKGLLRSDHEATAVAFVKLTEAERQFSFIRNPGADTTLAEAEVDFEIVRNTKIFHFGSLSLTDEPARTATVRAARAAKAEGALVSYDPNYRPTLWKDHGEANLRLRGAVQLADIIKISLEEAEILTGESDVEAAAEALLNQGVTCVLVTLGAEGALAATAEGFVRKSAAPCVAVDTTGAGDVFLGSFLYRLAKSGKTLAEHSLKDLEGYLAFANAAAALCVEKRGAMPSMPDISTIYEKIGM